MKMKMKYITIRVPLWQHAFKVWLLVLTFLMLVTVTPQCAIRHMFLPEK